MDRSLSLLLLMAALCAQALLFARQKPAREVSVPFVGCESHDQLKPIDAPKRGLTPKLPPEIAKNLAYYKADIGIGMLASRGWYCDGALGSGGSLFHIQPNRIVDLQGPAIESSFYNNGGSGGYMVAELIPRSFLAYLKYVEPILSEFNSDPGGIARAPYPTDVLTQKSSSVVEFRTPARAEGLGTQWLHKGDDPIDGAIVLLGGFADSGGNDPEGFPAALTISVRLPSNLRKLSPIIIQQLEREAPLLRR